LIMK